MTSVVYDGTFQGWLTAVFEVYEYKFNEVVISTGHHQNAAMFAKFHTSNTDDAKAARVWKGLSQKISAAALRRIYKAFLSEQKGIENMLLQYVRYVFSSAGTIEHNYAHPAVLAVSQTAKKVDREKHRMEAFIRFQLTKDKLYYAICQPDFNVLPLIQKHFKDRYADQKWLIYDSTRNYGIYYNLTEVDTVQISFSEDCNNAVTILDEHEELYQQLWQQYFKSVNIAARKNTKLHIQHMPKRYWKFLTEKQVSKRT
jgi:probable DNA metabolism protein